MANAGCRIEGKERFALVWTTLPGGKPEKQAYLQAGAQRQPQPHEQGDRADQIRATLNTRFRLLRRLCCLAFISVSPVVRLPNGKGCATHEKHLKTGN